MATENQGGGLARAVDTLTGDPELRSAWLIAMGALAYLVVVGRVFRAR